MNVSQVFYTVFLRTLQDVLDFEDDVIEDMCLSFSVGVLLHQ